MAGAGGGFPVRRFSSDEDICLLTIQVVVRDNNVEQALKALKRKLQREGVFREIKLRHYYEKPTQKRTREKAEAIRRLRKLARKRAMREGLLTSGGRSGVRLPRR